MKAALYGTPADNPELVAFGQGMERAAWRHPSFWRSNEAERFDLVVVSGLWGSNADILRVYTARGVPVVVLDWPYFRDRSHYWQVSVGGLSKPPMFDCPQDRFNALGLPVRAKGGSAKGYTLIACQRPADRSHGLSVKDYATWEAAQDGKLRPHPKESTPNASLADDLNGAACVKTLCSTVGIDALIAGVPAVADLPERAAWGALSGTKLPSVKQRTALFSRLAYGQWTLDEMASGDCARFLLDNLERWHDADC